MDYPDAKADWERTAAAGKRRSCLTRSCRESILPNRVRAAAQGIAGRRTRADESHVLVGKPRQSIALDATNADAHNILGAALASQNNLGAAIPEFREALRLNPKHESALRNLAQATAFYGRSNTSNTVGR